MRRRRYEWRGYILYVALVRGKWMTVYDGKCGDQQVAAAGGLKPEMSSAMAQKRLDDWAAREGLEEWRP